MAGIYIHIPFCQKRCTYCDFYTEVAHQFIPELVDSVVKELAIRKNYLNDEHITFRCDVASVQERRLELENRWRSNL